jgi:tripartite-type tricarboxylate transporter receptor subunit TctC
MKFLNNLRFVFGVLALAAVSTATLAQGYPNKPIRFIVPYPPGGASDVLARALANKMSESMGQSIVVENRAGAGGNIGADFVAKAAPDGYTLLMGNIGPNAISPALYPRLPYDPIKDFTPISLVSSVPIVLVAHPSFPASNMKEVIALAKSKPGQFNYASAGNGSSNHLAMELLKSLAGVNFAHVAYKGGSPAMADLIAGHIQIAFDTLPVALPHVKAGKVKAIALAGTKGSSVLPELPTIADSGVAGYEASSWGGLMAPGGTPRDVVDKLNLEVNRALGQPDVRESLAKLGIEPVGTTPEQFATYIEAEIKKWKRVVSEAGIKLE